MAEWVKRSTPDFSLGLHLMVMSSSLVLGSIAGCGAYLD